MSRCLIIDFNAGKVYRCDRNVKIMEYLLACAYNFGKIFFFEFAGIYREWDIGQGFCASPDCKAPHPNEATVYTITL